MEAKDALREAADALCQDPAFRAAIARHCRAPGGRVDESRLSTRIHPNDQMLQHSLRHFGDVNLSLSQYFNVALQQHHAARQLLRLYFGGDRDDLDILDFACGYGRFLRLLVLGLPPERIWAAEIQHDAVDHVVREFGVHGIYSDVDPQRFEPGRAFDFIWVASLFSHLPEPLFHAWLARLVGVLKPGGVLCFSVHDERLIPAGTTMPAAGIHYLTESENADLDRAAYGTTFVSEAFVRGAVDRACGAAHPYHRVVRGLANHQDLYVVPRSVDRDLARLDAFRMGAWGSVDTVRVRPGAKVYVSGWAASLDDAAIDAVELRVDGVVSTCRTGVPREDVRAVLADPRLATAGWELTVPFAPDATSIFIEVSARTSAGEAAPLYVGRIRRPPDVWGYVDVASTTGDGRVRVAGWAAALDNSVIEVVEVAVDGERARCRPQIERPDVRAALASPRVGNAGWEVELRCDSAAQSIPVEVDATLASGERVALFSGQVALASPTPTPAPAPAADAATAPASRGLGARIARLFR